VVMVLDVLQRRLGDRVSVRGLLFGVAEKAEREPEVEESPAIATRDGARGIPLTRPPSAGAPSRSHRRRRGGFIRYCH
jgi:hypothetical protein